MGLIDIMVVIATLFLGFEVAKRFRVTPRNRSILQWLWAYHMLFGVAYWAYITFGSGGDAYGYWYTASHVPFSEIAPRIWTEPTYFVAALCIPLAGILKLSFFSTSMLFCLVGYIGIAFAYVTYERIVPYNAKIGELTLFPFIFFLPNLHFWSSGIGKDTIILLCITLFFFCLLRPKKNMAGLIVSIVLSYFVRPHIALFLITATGIGFTLDGRLKAYKKVLIMTVLVACGVWMFGRMADFLKVAEIDPENIAQFAQARASSLSSAHVGSAIDINSYPWLLKLVTFLYRPLFFDAHNLLALIASFENLLLVVLSIRVLASKPFFAFRRGNYVIKAAIIFVLIGSIGSSMIMSNFGIILRQKNMFIPALYLFIGWTLALKNSPDGRLPKTSR